MIKSQKIDSLESLLVKIIIQSLLLNKSNPSYIILYVVFNLQLKIPKEDMKPFIIGIGNKLIIVPLSLYLQ